MYKPYTRLSNVTLALLARNVGLVNGRQKKKYWWSVVTTPSMQLSGGNVSLFWRSLFSVEKMRPKTFDFAKLF